MSAPLLSLSGLEAGYGQATVLRGVGLTVREGEVTVILGANGAGKTTLMRVLAGLLPSWAGEVRLDGTRIDALSSDLLVEEGLVLVPEGRLLFAQMTVAENLRVGAYARRARSDRDRTLESVYALFPRLAERRDQSAGTLSGGEQQMVAIGRGLMAQPRILLLDEPTLGLAPLVAKQIFEVIRGLIEGGLTVLLAEQDVRRSLQLAAQGYVLENGVVALAGSGEDLLARDEIRQAYLGL